MTIDVAPAHLHHADFGVGEVVDHPLQHICGRNEVGIQDEDEIVLGHLETVIEGARLVAVPVVTMDVVDVDSLCLQLLHCGSGAALGLIGRVVEHLDLKPITRIVQSAHGADQSFYDVKFIEDR